MNLLSIFQKSKSAVMALTLGGLALLAQPAQADMFILPVDCDYGKTCYIQKYADAAGGKDYKDYQCGMLTNDDHKGTDFRLLDFDALEAGVNILAAADGKVIQTRDYMPDVNVKLVGKEAVWDRGYGNLVAIEHANGLRTLYVHLKRNSISVKTGQTVNAGDVIGQMGLSGLTEYPHLHFEVLKGSQRLDPFTGLPINGKCGEMAQSLWKDDFPYKATHLIRLGLFSEKLSRQALEYKMYENARLRTKAKNLFLHALMAGVRKGDELRIQIFHKERNQAVFDASMTVPKDLASEVFTGGKSDRKDPWPIGTYQGVITYKRDGEILFRQGTETVIR